MIFIWLDSVDNYDGLLPLDFFFFFNDFNNFLGSVENEMARQVDSEVDYVRQTIEQGIMIINLSD